MQNRSGNSSQATAIKIIASALVLAGLGLWLWQLFSELPTPLDRPFWYRVSAIANIALVIHLIEGLIAAILTFRVAPSSRVASSKFKDTLRAGVYVFFVGTVGLQEIIEANKTNPNKIASDVISNSQHIGKR